MKRFFILIFSFAVLALAALGLCACGHTHQYEDKWELVTEATCSNEGLEQRPCVGCGEMQTRAIAKLAHTEVVDQAVAVTCTTDGKTEGKHCSVCGTVTVPQQTIAKLGHDLQYEANKDYGASGHSGTHNVFCQRENCDFAKIDQPCDYLTVDTPATCETAGKHLHECRECGDKFEHEYEAAKQHNWSTVATHIVKDGENYHRYYCLNDSTHFSEEKCTGVVKEEFEATCTENGWQRFSCDACGHEYIVQTTEATGHVFAENGHNGWKPNERTKLNECTHTRNCTKCAFTETLYCTTQNNIKVATCEEKGTNTVTCRECGRADVRPLGTDNPLGHEYGSWKHIPGTQTHKHICSRCSNEEIEQCVEETSEKIQATCNAKGQSVTACKDCLYVYSEGELETLAHEWIGGEDGWTSSGDGATHYRECSVCHTREKDNCDLQIVDEECDSPTCTATGTAVRKCAVCQQIKEDEIPALGHQYSEDVTTYTIDEHHHERQCLRCQEWDNGEHTYNRSNLCDACKYDALIYEEQDGGYFVADDNVKHTGSSVAYDGLLKNAKEIMIPSTHKGKNVIGIKNSAFMNNGVITSLVLPSTIMTIEDMAFYYCTNLKTVIIAGEDGADFKPVLTSIGNWAFAYCKELVSADNLPGSLVKIGDHAFFDCANLSRISISDSVLEIGNQAFVGTAYVKNNANWTNSDVLYIGNHLISIRQGFSGEFAIKEGILSISADAFKDCTGLSKITLPSTLKEIDKDAFAGCVNLKEVVFGGTFAQWLAVKCENDNASPMHFASTLTIAGEDGSVAIPADANITAIPAGAFKGSAITEITIPASVRSIGAEAFLGCESLTKITVEGSLTYVGKDAFKDCGYYLATGNWTDNGTSLYIGHALVAAKDGLTQLVTPDGTTSIAVGAFAQCTTLTHLTIDAAMVYIGGENFNKNSALISLAFEDGKNWMSSSASQYVGRVLDLSDAQSNASNIKNLYDGAWNKMTK